jgi:pimeloyl-ACP methyl ester carboxylesterase
VERPRVLLVHGSVVGGAATWGGQRPLAEEFELVVPDRRSFPPNPALDRVDFEDEAVWLEDWIEPGTHLVGHSYGGVIALLAAARRPGDLRSLTVVEPPAFGVARGNPVVDEFVARGDAHWRESSRDPETFLRGFLAWVGSTQPPGQLSPALEQGARTLMVERLPWEAEIPFETLAAAPFPKLVVSGAHNPAFEAVADVLEHGLGAQRAVLPGAGHSVQRLGQPFNELLAAFIRRAERA